MARTRPLWLYGLMCQEWRLLYSKYSAQEQECFLAVVISDLSDAPSQDFITITINAIYVSRVQVLYGVSMVFCVRPSNDLVQLAGGTAAIQPTSFESLGIGATTTTAPSVMPSVRLMMPSIPFQANTFPPAMPQTQQFATAVPSAQQAFPSAVIQAGSYPATASLNAVPLQASGASSATAANTAVPQNTVRRLSTLIVEFK